MSELHQEVVEKAGIRLALIVGFAAGMVMAHFMWASSFVVLAGTIIFALVLTYKDQQEADKTLALLRKHRLERADIRESKEPV
jgi:predicted MFS family arabinose efflux permease